MRGSRRTDDNCCLCLPQSPNDFRRRQAANIVELYGSLEVMNTYLKIAASLSLAGVRRTRRSESEDKR